MKVHFTLFLYTCLFVLFLVPGVSQGQNEFTTTWKTDNPGTSGNNQITIPTFQSETYNYTVDWGDGNIYTGVTGDTTHTYSVVDTYTVKISGVFPRIHFNNGGDKEKLLSIEQWGDIAWSSFEDAFNGCINLDVVATDIPDLSSVVRMTDMFRNCSSLVANNTINSWDVSNVEEMRSLFTGCILFNQNIGSWDVSKVTDMGVMFFGARNFNQDIGSWNVSLVERMDWMFRGTVSFNQDLGSWDVGSVVDMNQMFLGATSFNQNIGSWDVSKVISMNSMFNVATSFNQDISSWDVGNVESMSNMFSVATSFNQPIGSWNVGKVTEMRRMFRDAIAFNQDISAWDVSSVIDMQGLFSRARSFNQPIGVWNVQNVATMQAMFNTATSFNQNIGSWDVSGVTDLSRMFFRASSFNQNISSWDVDSVVTMEGMFEEADSFNQDLSSWDVRNVVDMGRMFSETSNFDQNLGDWNVSKVTNMASMFFQTGLSTTNYDSLLMGWNSLPSLQDSVIFDGGSSEYCFGESARQNLIDTYGWTISDSGFVANCDPACKDTTFLTVTVCDTSLIGMSSSLLSNKRGCDSLVITSTVLGAPIVLTLELADTLCLSAGIQTGLGGGLPEGGVYSGFGVADDGNGLTFSFDPTIGGVGAHEITYSVAQRDEWMQLGLDIEGSRPEDAAGHAVALSQDGQRLAIGAPQNDSSGNEAGQVRILEWDGASWVQLGQDLLGETTGDRFGHSLALSSDGNRVAVGAINNGGTGPGAGHVRIFSWNGTSWVQLGLDIDGEASGDQSGWSVDLSADGNRVAIGARSNNGNGGNSGHVRIFSWNGTAWVQLGTDIDGEAGGDVSGHSVSLSADGNRVAIGAITNDGNGPDAGQVRIFGWNGTAWTQVGQDIDGEATLDQFGYSVSLSADGQRIAIGAIFNNGGATNSGHARVYELLGSTWTQLGGDIEGEAEDDRFGWSISLSSDGSRLVVGARLNDSNGPGSGQAKVYELIGSTWTLIASIIAGEAGGDEAGYSVSLSGEGNRVGVGAPQNDDGGDFAGHARVFELTTFCPNSVVDTLLVVPNDTTLSSRISM